MTAVTVPDYMGDVRDWLRAALPPVSGRVFFRFPRAPVYPMVRMYDAGTVNQVGETPLWDARLSFEVWGDKAEQYATVSAAATALMGLLHATPQPYAAGGTWITNIDGITGRDLPDPDTGAPRRVIDAVFTLRAL